jgi:hypothetical protein
VRVGIQFHQQNYALLSVHSSRIYTQLLQCTLYAMHQQYRSKPTIELYKINRERHRFLGNEAENQRRFIAFAAPSSGQMQQKRQFFCFTPLLEV